MDAFAAGDDRVVVLRRRAVLSAACSYASGAAGLLLAACGGRAVAPSATVAPPGVAGSSVAVASPVRPGPASPTLGTPTGVVTPVAAMPATPTAITKLVKNCPTFRPSGNVRPEEPFSSNVYIDSLAVFGFADRVREADLIAVGTVQGFLPTRWNTVDGSRPTNLHQVPRELFTERLIVTPVVVAVELVAKGNAPFAELYLAEAGGQIGQDCVGYPVSGHSFEMGQRSVFLVTAADDIRQPPLAGDGHFRFYAAREVYRIADDGMIEFYVDTDLEGRGRVAIRRIPLAQALQEIAAILAAPSPTPIR